jgi:hypothetical protein
MSDYSKKYLKYKLKYNNLKKKQRALIGGSTYRFERKFDSDEFNDCKYIAESPNGNIIISIGYNRIKIFNSDGTFVSEFGSPGFGDGQFNNITAITVLTNGNIVVSDAANQCVQIFDSNGLFLSKFSYQTGFPSGISQTVNENIIICNDQHFVQIVDISGNLINKFGSEGSSDGEFIFPKGIAGLANGNIAVCDMGNHRVQIFNSNGVYQSQFGSIGGEDGKFVNPIGIAQLANGNIVVLDGTTRVQIFNSDGIFISKFGSRGSTDDEFNNPTGITKLANGNIAICDNNCVKIFETTGIVSETTGIVSETTGIASETPVSIQDVITNINYVAGSVFAGVIDIKYFEISKEKINGEKKEIIKEIIFDFDKEPFEKHSLFETLYQNRQILLTPYYKPQFQFWNIATGIKDEGVDAGGLARTVFEHLSNSLLNSIFFIRDPETNLFRLKTLTEKELDTDQNKNKLYFIGQLFGLAIKLSLTIQINLEPLLLYQLAHDIDIFNFDKEQILSIINEYDSEILEQMPYMCFDINPDTLVTTKIKNECLYNSEGEPIIEFDKLKTNEDKIIDTLEIDKIKNETVNRIIEGIKENKKVTEIFVCGFRSQINIKKSKINRLPLNLLDELISGIVVKDYETLFKNLEFKNFTQIQQTYLEEILKNQICTNIQSKYIGLLLMVMTGSKTIPASRNYFGIPYYSPYFEIKNLEAHKPIEIHSCFSQFIINEKLFNDYANAIDTGVNKKDTELYNLFNLNTLEKLKNEFSVK